MTNPSNWNDIRAILEQCKAEIQANMASKGINASGRTSRNFVVKQSSSDISLVLQHEEEAVQMSWGSLFMGVAPLQTLEIGRPGGNVPGGFRTTKAGVTDVSNLFKALLVQWGQDKGISGWSWGQATMLGRRIAQSGTLRNTRNEDVYSTPVEKAKQAIREILQADIRTALSTSITVVKR